MNPITQHEEELRWELMLQISNPHDIGRLTLRFLSATSDPSVIQVCRPFYDVNRAILFLERYHII